MREIKSLLKEHENAGIGIVLVLILITFFLTIMIINSQNKLKPRELSQKARIVKNFLTGKAVPIEKAWWFYGDKHSLTAKKKNIAAELGMDYGDLREKLEERSCLVVYNPPNQLNLKLKL